VVVQGLALSDLTHLLNLSPSKLRGQIRHRRQVRDLATISSLVAGVLLLGAMLLGFQLVRQSRLAGRLDRALHTTAASARTVREQQRSVELVTAVLEERKRLARALAGIFRQTPSTVTLEGLGFEQARGELTLRGLAGSNQEVLAYRKALEGVEGVARVDLKYSMQRAGRVSFELALRLGAGPHPPRAGSS